MPLYYSLMKRRKELLAQENNGRNCTSARFSCITKSSGYREGEKSSQLVLGEKAPSFFTDYLNEKKSKIKWWWHAK
jgi:hypothetical protein